MTQIKLHHVVFCVQPKNENRAAELWTDLGLEFEEVHLPELGLRILLDWSAGIEIVSPTELPGTETGPFREFLEEAGEGLYTVVVRTPRVDWAVESSLRYGAELRFDDRVATAPIARTKPISRPCLACRSASFQPQSPIRNNRSEKH